MEDPPILWLYKKVKTSWEEQVNPFWRRESTAKNRIPFLEKLVYNNIRFLVLLVSYVDEKKIHKNVVLGFVIKPRF